MRAPSTVFAALVAAPVAQGLDLVSASAEIAKAQRESFGIGDRLVRAFTVFDGQPLTATAAAKAGWRPTGKCEPSRGMPYMFGGKPSRRTPTSLYFGGAGQITGVGVDVYDYDQPSLVKAGWFDKVGTDELGDRHHLSLTFRGDGDLCEAGKAWSQDLGDRVVVNAHSIAFALPLTAEEAARAKFTRGSFFKQMGWHYALDLETAPKMSWKDHNLMPVIPMYADQTGEIRAILFAATPYQQLLPLGVNATSNQWEPAALNPFNMCKNFCAGETKNVLGLKKLFPTGPCQWEQTFATMHFFFRDYNQVTVPERLSCFVPGIGCCEKQ